MRLYRGYVMRKEFQFLIVFAGTFETFALDIDKKMTKQNKAMCTPGETKMQVRIHFNQVTQNYVTEVFN